MYLRSLILCFFFFFKQKTAYEMRISDWSSDVCSSDLRLHADGTADDVDCGGRAVKLQATRFMASVRHGAVEKLAVVDRRRVPGIGNALFGVRRVIDRRPAFTRNDRDGELQRIEHFRGGVLEHVRSEEHTSELQSLMRISYDVYCFRKKQD